MSHAAAVQAPGAAPAGHRPLTGDVADAMARVLVGGLFLPFAMRFGADFLSTGRYASLLLLCSESLIVLLTLVRRSALAVDRRWTTRLVTAASIAGPFLLRPAEQGAPEVYTSPALAAGLLVVIGGKLSLGRSFGVVPANRGIVCEGLYRVVRHPIYAGYLVTHVAFLAANPHPLNLALLVAADTALLVRALREEETLRIDPRYASYCVRVRWRILPGLF